MNYKVLEYLCGCKYILVCDENTLMRKGAAIHDHSKPCPEHKQRQKNMTVWCLDCHKKMVMKPQAGYNKKRCAKCAAENTRKIVREAWREGRYDDGPKVRTEDSSNIENYGETQGQMIERVKTKIIRECQHLLPILETPELDRLYEKWEMENERS